MRVRGIDPGDLVLASKRGRLFYAKVRAIEPDGSLSVEPLERNISFRRITAREVADHWSHAGRPRTGAGTAAPGQLDMNEWITA